MCVDVAQQPNSWTTKSEMSGGAPSLRKGYFLTFRQAESKDSCPKAFVAKPVNLYRLKTAELQDSRTGFGLFGLAKFQFKTSTSQILGLSNISTTEKKPPEVVQLSIV